MADINDKRIFILNERDEQELYALPIFSQSDREAYFYLDEDSQDTVDRLRSLKSKTYFILLLGYFRAKPIIHQFRFKEVQGDLEYVCQKHFPNRKLPRGTLPVSTRTKIANRVLALTGFSAFKPRVHRRKLMERIRDVATIRIEPQYIFDECLAFFGQERIALATYTTIQTIVSNALAFERKRLEQVMLKNISELTRIRLKKILDTKGAISKLARIKQVAKDFSKIEISRELEAHSTIKEIYPALKVFVKKLDISPGNFTYYASLVKHKPVYKLRRYTNNQGLLYLACYLYFRYRESNDNLVDAFSHLARKHKEAAKNYAKQCIANDLEAVRDKLKSAACLLRYFVDDGFSDTTQFGDIRKNAFQLLSRDEIRLISNHIDNSGFDITDYEWQYVDTHSMRIRNSLRKLFVAIDIDCDPSNKALSQQIAQAKVQLSEGRALTAVDQRLMLKTDRPYPCKAWCYCPSASSLGQTLSIE